MSGESLVDLFDIAADVFETFGDGANFRAVLAQAGNAAPWYWILGPARGRPRPQIQLANQQVNFASVVFPKLRQVFPALIANEIVSVQPMTAPAGAIFYMDYKYSGPESSEPQYGPIAPPKYGPVRPRSAKKGCFR